MATLKKQRKQSEKIKALDEEVAKSAPKESSESSYINEEEKTALEDLHEKDTATDMNVSIRKMQKAVDVAQEEFNLFGKNFVVSGFNDKGAKCVLALFNDDFELTVTVKDTEKFGIL